MGHNNINASSTGTYISHEIVSANIFGFSDDDNGTGKTSS